MYNLSFRKMTFPDKWKMANIIPLQKTGDTTDVNNLRPVSLLPLPGKIAERIIHTRMYSFLENNNLLNQRQGGFRKNNSTVNTVAEFTVDMLLRRNESESTATIFIDLKKAFNTVNHKILLKKISKCGFPHSVILWLKNYLTGRVQKTLVNGKESNSVGYHRDQS